MNILVLDDDPAMIEFYREVVFPGDNVTSCQSIQCATRNNPADYDAVLLDHYLADETGEEIARQWFGRVPIVMSTGASDIRIIERLSRYGQVVKKVSIHKTVKDFVKDIQDAVMFATAKHASAVINANGQSTVNVTIK